MEDVKQTILELKIEAEAHISAFNVIVKKITDMGFKVAPQADNTIYIFRDVREAYGEIFKPAQNDQKFQDKLPSEQRVQ